MVWIDKVPECLQRVWIVHDQTSIVGKKPVPQGANWCEPSGVDVNCPVDRGEVVQSNGWRSPLEKKKGGK